MKQYLAMFDMDGTLFDTKDANFAAYEAAFAAYGYDLSEEFYKVHGFGKHFNDFGPVVTGGDMACLKDIHQMKKEVYPQYLHKTRLNIHLFNMIEYMRENYYIALITTAARKSVTDLLNFHQKTELFDLIIAGEDAVKTKPDPEGFIKAMRFFNMDAAHSVIFEDSSTGLEAARAAGAAVIKIEAF